MTLGAIALFILAIIFYLLPCVIAAVRNARHSGMIFFINLVFGWTVLGWIAALIWAIAEAPEEPRPIDRPWSDKPIPTESSKKYETVYHPPD